MRIFKQSDSTLMTNDRLVKALCVLVVALIAAVLFLVVQQRTVASDSGNADDETAALVEQVSEVMLLPDETPSTTTIENPEELQSNTFFQNVQQGDEVLIFTQNAVVVVYRPSTHQIVNVGPITTDTSDGSDATAGAEDAGADEG